MKAILFYGKGEYVSVDPQNIICVKADKRYVEVFIKDTSNPQKQFVKQDVCVNLGSFQKKLPRSIFCRASRQMVVNTGCVKTIRDGAVQLHTDVGEPILLGKTYCRQFMSRFNRIQ